MTNPLQNESTSSSAISAPNPPNYHSISTKISNINLLTSNLNNLVKIQLDASNFSLWKIQIQNALRAFGMLTFVDGSTPHQSEFILNTEGVAVQNPSYDEWSQIDSRLLSCITATLSPYVLSEVKIFEHANEIWDELHRKFTKFPPAVIHSLRDQLHDITKGYDTMTAYTDKIKSLMEKLAVANSPVADVDVVKYTLDGLDSEYQIIKECDWCRY